MKVKGLLSDFSYILSHFRAIPDKNVKTVVAIVEIITDLTAITVEHLIFVRIPDIVFAMNVFFIQGLSP